jgi:hypothetical protein
MTFFFVVQNLHHRGKAPLLYLLLPQPAPLVYMKSAFLATLATVVTATNNHTAIDTNVCGVNWYYCPRDPGCKTYTMSVHDMEVHANDYVRHNLTTPLRTTPLFIFNFKYFQKKI